MSYEENYLATKSHQRGLEDSADESDGKMFETPDSLHCPVKTLENYLKHLNNPNLGSFFNNHDRNLPNSI